ncbi:putative transcriptional regulator [Clostridium neonatale]|uniref:helix-turn-helix domain-containing protein n=1 Tax=Clostridium neonatale TaxID=137838 RepID=UPI00291C4B5C|nr:helix-turn-helix transcriptional regulator [Clostridium neonatale]CAI3244094.1 putative transcriptional regulator [Clostridium neonatale]CAI3539554.1 putative transcriptional regulator [Clostridium neonatale]
MNLKDLRKESGIKAYKIAKELNISRVQLNNIERGKIKVNEEKIFLFSNIYKKDIDDIKTAWEVSISERA